MWSPISCAFAKTSNEMAEVFIDFYQSQRESDGRDDVALRQDSDETKVSLFFIKLYWAASIPWPLLVTRNK